MNRNLSPRKHISYFLNGLQQYIKINLPIFLTFFVTSRCNAKCKHCFYFQRIEDYPRREKELTFDEIERITLSIPSLPKLLLSGGEPFLRDDIALICEAFYKNSKVGQITIPTNCLLPDKIIEDTKKILEHCKNLHLQLQLSIDGIDEEHDKIRQVKGAFKKVLATYNGLNLLRKRFKQFEINFCCTFSQLNQDSIGRIYNFLKSLNNTDLSLVLTRGSVKDESVKKFDIDKYLMWMSYLLGSQLKEKRTLAEILFLIRRDYQTKLIYKVMKNNNYKFRCVAGRLTAVIDEHGIVYPCEMINFAFGSLKEEKYNFSKIWNSKLANQFRRQIYYNKCRCTHETNMMTNITFSPVHINKIVFRTLWEKAQISILSYD